MKKLTRVSLWANTVLVLALASIPPWSPLVLASTPTTASAPVTQTGRQIVLSIEGMTCGGCASNAQAALVKVPGVKSASVSYEKGQAVIVADPSVTEESLVKAIEGAGYRVPRKAASAVETELPMAPITMLNGSLDPLIEQFNKDKNEPRVLALLSPT